MPARDVYHNAVVNALIKDGWKITHDPLVLKYGKREMFADLGAERPIAAEKDEQKIAVEIKSFLGPSDIYDLEIAIGQFTLYRSILLEQEPARKVFIAITNEVYSRVFADPLGQLIVSKQQLNLIVFDDERERILQWVTH